MLEIKTSEGAFDGYVNLYNHMKENNLNEVIIISISFYSEHLESLRDNAINLFNSFFQNLGAYTMEQIKEIVY